MNTKELVKQAIEKYPEKVKEYIDGKTSLLGLFMGEVMKLSNGQTDPKEASNMIKERLDDIIREEEAKYFKW